ncbi:MAG: tryptophan synthase subunit alpha [Chloroflexota bacterium]|nr:tryptophan synthase subunit alpha [Chloroflexota bacterium]
MSGIAGAFASASAEHRAALIPYLMVGFPEPGAEPALAATLEAAGADILELGLPFSDPLADGPTVQRAANRSLAAGTTMSACILSAARIRERTALPLVMMGYLNPLLAYGIERFCADAAAAGVDGLIVPDLPPEEAEGVRAATRAHAVDLIYLLAPTSTDERIQQVAGAASGFIYCVSLTGVTGARSELSAGLEPFLQRVRRHTDVPLAVGFGISKPEHVAQVSRLADGVVVASALLDLLDRLPSGDVSATVNTYVASLRAATIRGEGAYSVTGAG